MKCFYYTLTYGVQVSNEDLTRDLTAYGLKRCKEEFMNFVGLSHTNILRFIPMGNSLVVNKDKTLLMLRSVSNSV